jgi:hypothetical protein
MDVKATAKKKSDSRFLSAVVLSIWAFAVLGCAETTTAPVVTTCVLPTDQSVSSSSGYYTLSGYWALKPVPIAFHAGDWSSSEMAAMTAAADAWNAFFSQSQKFSMIDYGSSSSPRTSSDSKPSNGCAQNIIGTEYNAPVVIYKDATWPTAYGSNLIALTSFCVNKSATTTLKPLTNAYVEVNYQNYFVSGQRNPDLQSIVLHELGHVVGLNHSCGSSQVGFPECSSSVPYTDAVMAPVFPFDANGNGEQKRALTSNDEGRANCLYDGGITGTTN